MPHEGVVSSNSDSNKPSFEEVVARISRTRLSSTENLILEMVTHSPSVSYGEIVKKLSGSGDLNNPTALLQRVINASKRLEQNGLISVVDGKISKHSDFGP